MRFQLRSLLLFSITPALAFVPSFKQLNLHQSRQSVQRKRVVSAQPKDIDGGHLSTTEGAVEHAGQVWPEPQPRRFSKLRSLRPRNVVRRVLKAAPVAAVLFSVALLRAGPAAAKTEAASKYDFTYDEYREERQANMVKSVGYVCVALTPLAVRNIIVGSKQRRNREKKRVTEAIEKLEVMRDEFMNVKGQASSDDDMFASLTARTDELGEEEAVKEKKKKEIEALKAIEEEKARGVEDLFGDEDDADVEKVTKVQKKDVGPYNRRKREARSSRKAPKSSEPKATQDEDDSLDADEDGKNGKSGSPTLASDEDVERLKRMFGSS